MCACVLGLVSRVRPRAFICLLAGPRINNAAIRTREERVKGGGGGGRAGRGPSRDRPSKLSHALSVLREQGIGVVGPEAPDRPGRKSSGWRKILSRGGLRRKG